MRTGGGGDLTKSSLPVVLARRYLSSGRKDSFVTFLSFVAAGGIAVGVAALILALSALAGFQSALRSEILLRTPEIEVEVVGKQAAEEIRSQLLARADVQSAQITLNGSGWIAYEGSVRPVSILGFEGPVPVIFPGAEGEANGLYAPELLAETWLLEPGSVVEIASGRPTLTPFGPQPRVARIRLGGTFAGGATEQRDRIAVPLSAAESLLGGSDYRILVEVGDLDTAAELADRLRADAAAVASVSGVSSWQDLNRALFFALKLEKTMMFLAVLLIVVVAALALVSDIHLIVASKRGEIGILGAMGATRRTITRAFVILGGGLGLAGVATGGLVGVCAAWLLGRYELIRLPAAVYFLDHVPFELDPADVFLVIASALVVAVVAAALGARSAAALRPVEALHH